MRIRSMVLISVLISLTACGSKSYLAVFEGEAGKNPVVRVDLSGKPYLRVCNLPSGMTPEDAGNFLIQAMQVLRKNGLSGGIQDVPVIQAAAYYPMFFNLARLETSGLKNEVLRVGLIQQAWMELVSLSYTEASLASFRKSEGYAYVQIPEISRHMESYTVPPSEAAQIYDYMNAYLLKEVLFVSLQEFTDRPSRYFADTDLSTPFSQVVIIPECAAFSGFMRSRIGNSRLLKLASKPFKPETWKSIAGEEINESESAFTHEMEGKSRTGIFNNPSWLSELNRWLSVYHRMTKPTLFRK